MDPTETLRVIRDIILIINSTGNDARLAELACDLAERVDALDAWMTRGGFLPVQWRARA